MDAVVELAFEGLRVLARLILAALELLIECIRAVHAGLPWTAVAVSGWLALVALGLGRWRDAPARLVVALAPLAGLAAVLYYATRGVNTDGDIVKTMFMLPAVPFWALSFGFATDVLVRRRRLVALPILGVLAGCAVVSLAYATFAFVS